MASGKQGLCSLLLWHILPRSVVAFGRIEQINESPFRFITNGQQIVASPIVAASRGTGMIYRICEWDVSLVVVRLGLCFVVFIPFQCDLQQARQDASLGNE